MNCPKCQSTDKQHKAGRNPSGSQRYRCGHCGSKYTPNPTLQGYPEATRLQAVRMYVDGMNLRRVARHLGVNHQSVANWVKAYAAQLPPAPLPEQVETIEMDELHTFVERKKTKPTS
jgi:transposase-like protein